MAKVNIKKMSVIALQQDKKKVLSILQKLGCAEVIDVREKLNTADKEKLVTTQTKRELRELLNDLKFTLEFLSRFSQTKKSIFAPKPLYSEEEMRNISHREEVINTVKTCRGLEKRLTELKSMEMKLQNTMENLQPWKSLDIPVESLGQTAHVVFQVGTVPEKNFEEFKSKIAEVSASYLEKIWEEREEAFVFLVYHKDFEKQVGEILAESAWSKQDLPEIKGTPKEALQECEKQLLKIQKERESIQEKAIKLAGNAPLIEVAFDYYTIVFERESAAEKLGATEKVFYLEGWIPEPETEKARKALTKEIDGIYIVFEEPETDEANVPTVVKNPKVVEPFELITDLYSLPGPNDIDPNIFMAPFFFLFFGMMISDAGYGIVLALLGLWALKKLKPEGIGKKLFSLIFLGGISTFIWGAMYGGWFGDLIKLPPLWFNPLEDPMRLLLFSFILGIIQIYMGLALQGYKNIRDGKTLDAVFDQGFWMVFLSGFLMFALPQTKGIARYVVIAGAIGLVLTQGRHQKSVVAKVGSGILSLYDVMSYVSDVLSYSRILALGLATGVIATVINTMGRLLGVNIIGYIIMVVLLVGGHLFNIAINALGAYVHSSRLQYVEFFSKFYEGGGRALEPFTIKTKYTKYRNGEEI